MKLTTYVGTLDRALSFKHAGVPVGYIVYNTYEYAIEKFEIFKPHRGKGYSKAMMIKFIESVKHHWTKIELAPLDEKLFKYYTQFGFKRYWRKSMKHLMYLNVSHA